MKILNQLSCFAVGAMVAVQTYGTGAGAGEVSAAVCVLLILQTAPRKHVRRLLGP